MDKAEHQPLDVYFDFAPQSEPVQALVNPDIGKNRLSNSQSLRVDFTDLPPVVVPSFKLGWGSSQANDPGGA
jgi:hypothetical protein